MSSLTDENVLAFYLEGTMVSETPTISLPTSQTPEEGDLTDPNPSNSSGKRAPREVFGNIRAIAPVPTEVPDSFRVNPLEISVAARNMPRTIRFWASGDFHAAVMIRCPDDDQTRTILRTETLAFDTFPYFVRKVWIPALDMLNSQEYAAKTTLLVELFSGTRRIGICEASLADLVWRRVGPLGLSAERNKFRRLGFVETSGIAPEVLLSVESYRPSNAGSTSVTIPEKRCNFYRVWSGPGVGSEGPSMSEETSIETEDTHSCSSLQQTVRLDLGVTKSLRDAASQKRLSFSVSRANHLGDWTALYRSRPLAQSNTFSSATIPRDVLVAGDEARQIRISLHSFESKQGSRLEGWVISRIDELEDIHKNGQGRAANLPWTKMSGETLDAGLEFRRMDVDCDGSIALQFFFKHGLQVEKETAAALAGDKVKASTNTTNIERRRRGVTLGRSRFVGKEDSSVSSRDLSRSSGGQLDQNVESRCRSRVQEDVDIQISRENSSENQGKAGLSSSDDGNSSQRLSRPSSLYVPADSPSEKRRTVLSRGRRSTPISAEVRFPEPLCSSRKVSNG